MYFSRIGLFFLIMSSAALAFATQCTLDQSNSCVFFVAANGDMCNSVTCTQESEPSCDATVQSKCKDFLNLGGKSCIYITENPYFTCEA